MYGHMSQASSNPRRGKLQPPPWQAATPAVALFWRRAVSRRVDGGSGCRGRDALSIAPLRAQVPDSIQLAVGAGPLRRLRRLCRTQAPPLEPRAHVRWLAFA